MPSIDKTSSATTTGAPASETADAGVAPKAAPVEASERFSNLLSKGRDGKEGGEAAAQLPKKAEAADKRPGLPREAHGRTAPRGADGTDAPQRSGAGPAPQRAVPEGGQTRAGEALRGPAEGLFHRAAPADSEAPPTHHSAAGARHEGVSHGGRAPAEGRPVPEASPRDSARPEKASSDDPRGAAERLAASGSLTAPAAATPQRADPPLGVSATSAASDSPDVDIIAELADRILVAEPKAGQNEVRIRLNMDTLQGAEITLKNDGTRLSVVFETPSPEIAERLAAAQPALAERLQEKSGLEVKVEIAHAEPQADKERDGERNDGRSRNRFDYEPDHGDDA